MQPEQPEITWLVNNAGFGKYGGFDDVSVDTNLNMIDLNVRALTEITQRALPYCPSGSHIVQVASSAGFAPLANFAVYAATKAYVVNFSNALSAELADAHKGRLNSVYGASMSTFTTLSGLIPRRLTTWMSKNVYSAD